MATKKKMGRAEERARDKEARLDARRKLAALPETKALFERAHAEPYVRGMKATEYGMEIRFHGLHPRHVNRLLDTIAQIRAEQHDLTAALMNTATQTGAEKRIAELVNTDGFLDRNVADLAEYSYLNTRVMGAIERLRITTVRQLLATTEETFLRQKNFGRRSLRELREFLADFGLALPRDA